MLYASCERAKGCYVGQVLGNESWMSHADLSLDGCSVRLWALLEAMRRYRDDVDV